MGECLSGALYTEDFRRMLGTVGCLDFRTLSNSRVTIQNQEIEKMVSMIEFFSITVRAFKLELEDRCEDYGQVAIYLGTVKDQANYFILDDHHLFEANKPMAVCKNTAKMISETRFGEHFKLIGNTETHFGVFDCAPAVNTKANDCST